MIEYGTEHLDELLIAVGVLLQIRADLGQAGWQVPVLERSPLRSAPGFLISTGR